MSGFSPLGSASSGWGSARSFFDRVAPGFLCAGMAAMAAQFVSAELGGPAMLLALLFGMSVSFLGDDDRCAEGLMFSSKTALKLGVALLGAQITVSEVAALGLPITTLVISGVLFTLIAGAAIGRFVGLSAPHAVLSAGSVAICGASAALAISSVLPRGEKLDQQTSLTVVGVTTLSTIAMVLYPLIARVFHFTDPQAGIFLGATIHDVAQVIGAGYTVSDEAGETAAIVKLMRVACLVPTVLAIGFLTRRTQMNAAQATANAPVIPLFLIGFVAIMLANSVGLVSPVMTDWASTLSQSALLTAVAALGMRTSLKDLGKLGAAPILALVAQTAALAVFAIIGILLIAYTANGPLFGVG